MNTSPTLIGTSQEVGAERSPDSGVDSELQTVEVVQQFGYARHTMSPETVLKLYVIDVTHRSLSACSSFQTTE